ARTGGQRAGGSVCPNVSAVRRTGSAAPPRSFRLLSFSSRRSEPATSVFTAGPELPDWPLVVRVSETPPTLSVTEAVPVTVPPELEVKVTVHWPLALVPVEAQVSVMRSEERRVGKEGWWRGWARGAWGMVT